MRAHRKKARKTAYCERALIYGPHVGIVLTERDYLREMAHLKQSHPSPWMRSNCRATAHTFTVNGGARACVVIALDQASVDEDKFSADEVRGTLVHEAVHVWQHFREEIGEAEPSHEFEAYCIDKISYWLFLAYRRALKRYRKKLEKKR